MDPSALRCLSIRQPWGHLILHAGKRLENRRWKSSFTGPVLIHAGRRLDEEAAKDEAFRRLIGDADAPRGGIVGACVITGQLSESPSPWFFGPYAFTLAHARPLPFVPMVGHLGFFRPTPEALAAVLPHLAGWPGWAAARSG